MKRLLHVACQREAIDPIDSRVRGTIGRRVSRAEDVHRLPDLEIRPLDRSGRGKLGEKRERSFRSGNFLCKDRFQGGLFRDLNSIEKAESRYFLGPIDPPLVGACFEIQPLFQVDARIRLFLGKHRGVYPSQNLVAIADLVAIAVSGVRIQSECLLLPVRERIGVRRGIRISDLVPQFPVIAQPVPILVGIGLPKEIPSPARGKLAGKGFRKRGSFRGGENLAAVIDRQEPTPAIRDRDVGKCVRVPVE